MVARCRDLDVVWLPRHRLAVGRLRARPRDAQGDRPRRRERRPVRLRRAPHRPGLPAPAAGRDRQAPRRRRTEGRSCGTGASLGAVGSAWRPRAASRTGTYITYRRLHLALPLRRRLPGRARPYGGSAYWCLCEQLVHFVHGFLEREPRLRPVLRARFRAGRALLPDDHHELVATGHGGERRPALPRLVARACARGAHAWRPAGARSAPQALRAEVRRDRGLPRSSTPLDRSTSTGATTSSADRPVGLPLTPPTTQRKLPAWIENRASDRFRPVGARSRPVDVPRARPIAFALSTLRVRYKQACFRDRLGGAPASARRDHLLDRLRPPRRRSRRTGIPYPVFNYAAHDPVALRLARRRAPRRRASSRTATSSRRCTSPGRSRRSPRRSRVSSTSRSHSSCSSGCSSSTA